MTNEKLLKEEDGAEKANVSLYRSCIGSLLCLTTTQPDIMEATSLLLQFIQNPSQIPRESQGIYEVLQIMVFGTGQVQ